MHLCSTSNRTFIRYTIVALTSVSAARVGVETGQVVIEDCGMAMKMEEGLVVGEDLHDGDAEVAWTSTRAQISEWSTFKSAWAKRRRRR
ncbi:hypothetical protein NL676_000708 [Syzygium grande]|nr:hypothetical protein NL676_000708 [Syzygium grande]